MVSSEREFVYARARFTERFGHGGSSRIKSKPVGGVGANEGVDGGSVINKKEEAGGSRKVMGFELGFARMWRDCGAEVELERKDGHGCQGWLLFRE